MTATSVAHPLLVVATQLGADAQESANSLATKITGTALSKFICIALEHGIAIGAR
jgi:hypothetical protein